MIDRPRFANSAARLRTGRHTEAVRISSPADSRHAIIAEIIMSAIIMDGRAVSAHLLQPDLSCARAAICASSTASCRRWRRCWWATIAASTPICAQQAAVGRGAGFRERNPRDRRGGGDHRPIAREIARLNRDAAITGILLQLPLPGRRRSFSPVRRYRARTRTLTRSAPAVIRDSIAANGAASSRARRAAC